MTWKTDFKFSHQEQFELKQIPLNMSSVSDLMMSAEGAVPW